MSELPPFFRRARAEDAVSTEEMTAVEVNSEWWGVSRDVLMENAGRAVAQFVLQLVGDMRDVRIAVVAGRGGNGGDGMVASRFLASRGAIVELHLTHDPSLVTHKATLRALEYVMKSRRVSLKKPWSSGWLELSDADIIVDAVLGTGVRGEPRGPVREAIKAMNSARAVKVAVDIPSGLDPDTGEASLAVRADYTLALHKPKQGLFMNKGPLLAGEVYVADIGIPPEAEEYAGPGDVARVPERPRDARKGDGGRVLVVGGSERFVGAPLLSARAAYSAGADLVYVYMPREYAYTAASCNLEVIPLPRELGEGFNVPPEVVEKVHAAVIGPGLGVSEESRRLVVEALEKLRGKPVVVDADALKILAELGMKLWPDAVMTPHRGEARLLSGVFEEKLEEQARAIASRYGATVVVKAPEDVVCDPRGLCRKNATGHQAMAVGGTGDVLSGAIAAFLARRAAQRRSLDTLNTVAAALYVVGRAGELAVEEKGENILPQDVASMIPRAIAEARRLAEASR